MTTGLADFFKHNLWANLRLLDVCANLTGAQLDATMKGTYGSIRQTLIHILAGEEGYVRRFTGKPPAPPAFLERLSSSDFDELRQQARKTGEELIALAEQYDPSQVLHLTYGGQSYEVPVIFVLIQVINHATDHRSQVATLLSQQDVTPPEIDGWGYYDAMSSS